MLIAHLLELGGIVLFYNSPKVPKELALNGSISLLLFNLLLDFPFDYELLYVVLPRWDLAQCVLSIILFWFYHFLQKAVHKHRMLLFILLGKLLSLFFVDIKSLEYFSSYRQYFLFLFLIVI